MSGGGGMKEGANFDPFEEDEQETEDESGQERSKEEKQASQSQQTLPYRFARKTAEDQREQKPIWLQEETLDLIDDRIDELAAQFDERVLRMDYLEAAILADAEDRTTEDVLREWGYDRR